MFIRKEVLLNSEECLIAGKSFIARSYAALLPKGAVVAKRQQAGAGGSLGEGDVCCLSPPSKGAEAWAVQT